MLWGLAILVMSGDFGAGKNTYGLLKWLLSGWELTQAQVNVINFYLRKTGHVVAYGLMYILWFRAFRKQVGYGPWGACFCALAACLLFSSLDEGRQWLNNSRVGSIWDVCLDLSGSSLAALLTFGAWRPRRPALSSSGPGERQAPE
ncbi:MAG: VanZ family protein [Desulfobaccales bacterium]